MQSLNSKCLWVSPTFWCCMISLRETSYVSKCILRFLGIIVFNHSLFIVMDDHARTVKILKLHLRQDKLHLHAQNVTAFPHDLTWRKVRLLIYVPGPLCVACAGRKGLKVRPHQHSIKGAATPTNTPLKTQGCRQLQTLRRRSGNDFCKHIKGEVFWEKLHWRLFIDLIDGGVHRL